MIDTVLHAVLANPDTGPIHLIGANGESAEALTREQLLQRGAEVAAAFRGLGVEPGDRVAAFLPNGRAFLETMFGAWMCRAALVPLASAGSKRRGELLLRRIASVMDAAAPRVVVGTDEALALVTAAGGSTGAHLVPESAIDTFRGVTRDDGSPHADDLALVQFTSGSTGTPRGVPVSHDQIVSNVREIGRRARTGPDDTLVSWLPVYHDMGFVGALCVPLLWGSGLVLSSPEKFIRNPASWLRLISDFRGTVSPAPTFAFDILGRLVSDHRLEGLDLSTWRYAWVGAEPVFQGHLVRFEERFRPKGLPDETLHPVYGLAEATLCVSAAPAEQTWRTLWVDAAALREQQAVEPAPPGASRALALVANGQPLDNMEIRIGDDTGAPLDGHVAGRVLMRGPSVMRSYFRVDPREGGPDADGWLDTGDLGFLHDGDLFITGRAKDVIIRTGLNVAPQDMEFAAQSAPGADVSRAAAFSCVRLDLAREEIVIVAETRCRPDAAEPLIASIRAQVLADVGLQVDHVELVPPGSIPRTTSGKVQRQLCRNLFLEGALHSSPPGDSAP